MKLPPISPTQAPRASDRERAGIKTKSKLPKKMNLSSLDFTRNTRLRAMGNRGAWYSAAKF